MRPALLLAVVLSAAAAALDAHQDAKPPVPKNGDTIVAKGCLHGARLEAVDARSADGGAVSSTRLTFRLKGKKEVLRDLVAEHDGRPVEITGILKSNIEGGTARGRKIGKTRIVVGAESTMRDRAVMPDTDEPLPVLEVRSFESAGLNCRR